MDARITAIIFIIIGLVLCLYGYKIQKLVITLAWFAIGFTVAGYIAGKFIEAETTLLIIKLVVGVILGSLGFKLEKLALLIAVAYLTYNSIGGYITAFTGNMKLAVQLGISVLVGILSTLFLKPIVICITSIAGAALVRDYIPTLITLQPNIITIGFIVLAACGILVQLKSN